MKILSLILFFIIFHFNVHAKQEDLLDTHSKKLNQEIELKQLDNKQLQELIKKLPRENSLTQNTSNEDWFKKLRPFIVPLLIVLYLIFRSDDKATEKPKKKRNNQSKIDEFIRRSNEKNKDQDSKSEDEFEKNFNDYFVHY